MHLLGRIKRPYEHLLKKAEVVHDVKFWFPDQEYRVSSVGDHGLITVSRSRYAQVGIEKPNLSSHALLRRPLNLGWIKWVDREN